MKRETLEIYLEGVETWNDIANASARIAFTYEVTGKGKGWRLDRDEALQGWELFLMGWRMGIGLRPE